MSLVYLIIGIILIGLLLWAVENYIPMEPGLRTLLRAVVVIAVIIWIAWTIFGGGGSVIGNGPVLR